MDALQVILCLFFVQVQLYNGSEARVVRLSTKQGRVTGKRTAYNYGIETAVTNVVDSFLGVPYARQPVGQLRFKDPWPTPRSYHEGFYLGPRCIQPNAVLYRVSKEAEVNDTMGEDCLRLNIWSPYQREDGVDAVYPVMVWIHGGSLQVGSGNWFDGHVLAQSGVVVVTINYRLGVLGFLSDGEVDSPIPGDYGIYDQIMALQWIQENIRTFRGDADRVTIFGSSAGAWSVSLHLLLAESQGLFHRAIVQSGPLNAKLSHFHSPMTVRRNLLSLAGSLNCTTDLKREADLLECLRGYDAGTLSRHAGRVAKNDKFQLLWKGSRLIPTEPVKMLRKGPLNRVPIMIGNVREEAGRYICIFIFTGEVKIEADGSFDRKAVSLDEKRSSLMAALTPILNMANIDLTDAGKRDVIDEYFTQDILADSKKITKTLIELHSDIIMVAPGVQMAKILRSRGLKPYFYIFNHSLSIDISEPDIRSTCSWLSDYSYHETELPFVFGNAAVGSWSKSVWHSNRYSAAERDMSVMTMKLWTDFARDGEPSPDVEWYPFGQNYSYLDMKPGLFESRKNLRRRKMDFWIRIFETRVPNNV